jgi:hypothetical protein
MSFNSLAAHVLPDAPSSSLWLTLAAPAAAAAVSVTGAVYVGWRQRKMTLQIAEAQAALTSGILARQLCFALGARALVMGERAAELKRVLTSPADATHSLRRAEIVRRTERFDRACDAFLDAWSDLVSSSLQTDQLVSCVDELKDELETFRLRALSGREDGDLSALVEVGRLAGECRAIAAGSALPRVARGHTSSLLRRLHW